MEEQTYIKSGIIPDLCKCSEKVEDVELSSRHTNGRNTTTGMKKKTMRKNQSGDQWGLAGVSKSYQSSSAEICMFSCEGSTCRHDKKELDEISSTQDISSTMLYDAA